MDLGRMIPDLGEYLENCGFEPVSFMLLQLLEETIVGFLGPRGIFEFLLELDLLSLEERGGDLRFSGWCSRGDWGESTFSVLSNLLRHDGSRACMGHLGRHWLLILSQDERSRHVFDVSLPLRLEVAKVNEVLLDRLS